MKNEALVEALFLVAIRVGLGETSEMPLMVSVLRKIADTLERRHEAHERAETSETP